MLTARPCPALSQAAKDSVINASQAIEIFLAKARRKSRDPASRTLAEEYGISMKAVRDIWNFRTWKWETMPYWSQEDLHDFFNVSNSARSSERLLLCVASEGRSQPPVGSPQAPIPMGALRWWSHGADFR